MYDLPWITVGLIFLFLEFFFLFNKETSIHLSILRTWGRKEVKCPCHKKKKSNLLLQHDVCGNVDGLLNHLVQRDEISSNPFFAIWFILEPGLVNWINILGKPSPALLFFFYFFFLTMTMECKALRQLHPLLILNPFYPCLLAKCQHPLT